MKNVKNNYARPEEFRTIGELQNAVGMALGFREPPKASYLEKSDTPVYMRIRYEDCAEAVVYENGWVLFKKDDKATVFRLHKVSSYYKYDFLEDVNRADERCREDSSAEQTDESDESRKDLFDHIPEGGMDSVNDEHVLRRHRYGREQVLVPMELRIHLRFVGEDRLEHNRQMLDMSYKKNPFDDFEEDSDDLKDDLANPLSALVREELRGLKARILEMIPDILTERQRDVVELYYGDRLTQREIAAELGIERSSVNDALIKARKNVRKLLIAIAENDDNIDEDDIRECVFCDE